MKIMVIADIHANLTALKAVFQHAHAHYGEIPIIHLGDVVDYGMRPNECLEFLYTMRDRILVNLAGNHEAALCGQGLERFSSERGRQASLYTVATLLKTWKDLVKSDFSYEPKRMQIDGKEILCVHGDLADYHWGGMSYHESQKQDYKDFDFVLSGHSHIRFLREIFHTDDSIDAKRGRKKTVFINPGSVGQPRNHNPAAQYAVVDFSQGEVFFHAVDYDIEAETVLFNDKVDTFYRDRLREGI